MFNNTGFIVYSLWLDIGRLCGAARSDGFFSANRDFKDYSIHVNMIAGSGVRHGHHSSCEDCIIEEDPTRFSTKGAR